MLLSFPPKPVGRPAGNIVWMSPREPQTDQDQQGHAGQRKVDAGFWDGDRIYQQASDGKNQRRHGQGTGRPPAARCQAGQSEPEQNMADCNGRCVHDAPPEMLPTPVHAEVLFENRQCKVRQVKSQDRERRPDNMPGGAALADGQDNRAADSTHQPAMASSSRTTRSPTSAPWKPAWPRRKP